MCHLRYSSTCSIHHVWFFFLRFSQQNCEIYNKLSSIVFSQENDRIELILKAFPNFFSMKILALRLANHSKYNTCHDVRRPISSFHNKENNCLYIYKVKYHFFQCFSNNFSSFNKLYLFLHHIKCTSYTLLHCVHIFPSPKSSTCSLRKSISNVTLKFYKNNYITILCYIKSNCQSRSV